MGVFFDVCVSPTTSSSTMVVCVCRSGFTSETETLSASLTVSASADRATTCSRCAMVLATPLLTGVCTPGKLFRTACEPFTTPSVSDAMAPAASTEQVGADSPGSFPATPFAEGRDLRGPGPQRALVVPAGGDLEGFKRFCFGLLRLVSS